MALEISSIQAMKYQSYSKKLATRFPTALVPASLEDTSEEQQAEERAKALVKMIDDVIKRLDPSFSATLDNVERGRFIKRDHFHVWLTYQGVAVQNDSANVFYEQEDRTLKITKVYGLHRVLAIPQKDWLHVTPDEIQKFTSLEVTPTEFGYDDVNKFDFEGVGLVLPDRYSRERGGKPTLVKILAINNIDYYSPVLFVNLDKQIVQKFNQVFTVM